MLVSGGNTTRGAQISSYNESTSGQPTSLLFKTNSAYATPTERMRIDSSGDVTINNDLDIGGTTTADDTITVAKNVAGNFQGLTINNSRGTLDEIGNASMLSFQNNSVTSGEIRSITTEDFTTSANQSADLAFYTRLNGTLSERVRINDDGNVGIGTDSPANKLDVAGTVRIQNTGAATLILDGDTNNSGDSGDTDSIIDMRHDAGLYGMRLSTRNFSGKSAFRIQENRNGTYSERFYINEDGNVGIGTTSPARELSIGDGTGSPNIQLLASTAGNSRIEFGDGDDSDAGEIQYVHSDNTMRLTTNGSEAMRINSSGNVGIGETSPSYKLDVHHGTAGEGIARFSGADSDDMIIVTEDGYMAIDTRNAASGLSFQMQGADKVRILPTGNVGIGTTSPAETLHIQKTSDGSDIKIALFENNATSVGSGASIMLVSGGNTTRGAQISSYNESTSGQPTSLLFKTNSAYATPTERVRIDSSGNVGIGVSPSAKLDVSESGSPTNSGSFDVVRISGADAVANDLTLIGPNTSQVRINFGDSDSASVGEIGYDHSANALRFVTSGAEAMRIDSSGNVGIGTTSPSTELDVDGTTTTNKLVADGTSTIGFSNLANASILAGTTSLGIGIDPNEIRNNGGNLYIGTIGANDINFGTGGTGDQVVIKSGGNVGIGTNSPSAVGSRTTLNISGSAGSAIRLSDDTANAFLDYTDGSGVRLSVNASESITFRTNSADKMTLDSSGNLGIGTTSPATNLHISSASSTPTARIESTHPSGIPFLDLKGAASSQIRYIDETGTIQTRMDFTDSGGISFVDVAGSASIRMTINSSGNVGIGTTSPAYKLHVEGSIGIKRIGVAATSTIDMQGNFNFDAQSGYSHVFKQAGSEVVRILPSGNVGIGTTNPSAKLDVAGDAEFADTVTISDNVAGTFEALVLNNSRGTLDEVGNVSKLAFQHNSVNAGEIRSVTEEDFTTTANQSARLEFYTRQNGTLSQALQLQVDNDAVFYGDVYVPDQIRHSDNINTYMQFHGNDLWRIVTGGVERIEISNSETVINDGSHDYNFRVESNNNANMLKVDGGNDAVGIGIDPSSGIGLHVYHATADAPLKVQSGDTFTGIQFTDPTTSNYLFYKGTENHFYFNGSGVTLGVGVNSITTTNLSLDVENKVRASGIMFGTDTADANTLDDYEEGSWTPVFGSSSSSVDLVSYDAVTFGRYIKVGNVVHLWGRIRTDILEWSGSSGSIRIEGVPFTATDLISGAIAFAGSVGYATNFSGEEPQKISMNGSEHIYLYYNSSSTANSANVQVSDMNSGSNANDMTFQLTYRTG